ncbi:SGNH hydrolase-type esterase domain-containing protein [Microdochium trichocladiopsis]|uniref:SGNH hydrolase-type esterase domain-containing protein n=1 Tax=Microdochium trichocladiopsis TaxID=1682393 RepID=A0A9P8YCK5_9PEZI|nr:SGNH hydrolase-type esterase domain-containing protein [Microdochium trichocladiopsis]KAH7033712.1 SGNH hydrolase-type esterase domain-containing protein [Microdochium trichocladiopsis]
MALSPSGPHGLVRTATSVLAAFAVILSGLGNHRAAAAPAPVSAGSPSGHHHQSLDTRQANIGKPVAFFLAGDSTTAAQSSTGGGWGPGFLSTLDTTRGATGRNFAKDGATTVSFVADGLWAQLTSSARLAVAEGRDTFVTIQFGHNDKNPAKGISLDAYQANLARMAGDVAALGATPILVTPLTKRLFDTNTTPPRVDDDLAWQQNRTLVAAVQGGFPFVDLHRRSMDYVNAIGPASAAAYSRVPGDNVHINARGSVVFGRLVADLVSKNLPRTGAWIKKDAELTGKIQAGVPA